MSNRSALAALLMAGALAATGCKSDTSDESKQTGESKQTIAPDKQAASTADAAPEKSKKRSSKFPPEARRNSAPEGIADTALAVGAMAPALEAVPSTAGAWTRGADLTVLVIYRGDW